MTQSPTASDWLASRGDKWAARVPAMEATLAPVDAPLLRALRLDAPHRVADVGCGGGGTALEILRCAPSGSIVHGYDISPALVEVARRRVGADEHAIAFDVADVSEVAPPARYQRLVSRFGVMFFADPEAAFANLLRWLVPGGRFAFAVWARTSDNPWFATAREVVAETVELPPPAPDGPGPFRYGSPEKLLAVLERAGFAELEVDEWRGELPIGGGLPATEAARFALASFSTFGELLLAAGDDAVARAQRSLTTRLAPHEKDGVVRMPACVHVVTGARPG